MWKKSRVYSLETVDLAGYARRHKRGYRSENIATWKNSTNRWDVHLYPSGWKIAEVRKFNQVKDLVRQLREAFPNLTADFDRLVKDYDGKIGRPIQKKIKEITSAYHRSKVRA